MGRGALRLATIAVLVFLYVPIGIIALYAFNANRAQTWPITKYTTDWFAAALDNEGVRAAFGLSLTVAFWAMAPTERRRSEKNLSRLSPIWPMASAPLTGTSLVRSPRLAPLTTSRMLSTFCRRSSACFRSRSVAS